MSRLSTVAVSTLTPALNVLSTTLPDSTFFSVVRTNAGPLPGLTCWNSVMVQSWPSRLSTRPFLKSLVEAMIRMYCPSVSCHVDPGAARPAAGSERQEFLGGQREDLVPVRANHSAVLDAYAAPARQVDPRLDGDAHVRIHDSRGGGRQERIFVDHQTDPVAQPVTELLGVPGVKDQVPGRRVDGRGGRPGQTRGAARSLGGRYQRIQVGLPVGGRS